VNKLLESWKMITGVITGTVATVAAIYASVTWFQPAAIAEKQHEEIQAGAVAQYENLRTEFEEHSAASEYENYFDKLEAELERIELAIKLYNDRSERRQLNADEQEELEYLRERRRQIRERLYGDDEPD